MKICSNCKQHREEIYFHKDKNRKDGLYPICKLCRNKIGITNDNKKKFDFYIKLSMIRSLKKNKHGIWEKVIKINLDDLKKHLEKQFDENMRWDNYGIYWGVSFIIPKKYFKYTNPKSNEFAKCWNIKNLRPLELTKCKKNTKIETELIIKYNLFDILPIGTLRLTKI